MNDPLFAAAIAAGSALLGSAIGQCGPLIQHWLAVGTERRKFLRERYEQVAHFSAELMVRLDRRTSVGEIGLQMHTLAMLYFPEICDAAKELHNASIEFDGVLSSNPNSDDQKTKHAIERFKIARRAMQEQLQANA